MTTEPQAWSHPRDGSWHGRRLKDYGVCGAWEQEGRGYGCGKEAMLPPPGVPSRSRSASVCLSGSLSEGTLHLGWKESVETPSSSLHTVEDTVPWLDHILASFFNLL